MDSPSVITLFFTTPVSLGNNTYSTDLIAQSSTAQGIGAISLELDYDRNLTIQKVVPAKGLPNPEDLIVNPRKNGKPILMIGWWTIDRTPVQLNVPLLTIYFVVNSVDIDISFNRSVVELSDINAVDFAYTLTDLITEIPLVTSPVSPKTALATAVASATIVTKLPTL